MIVTREFVRKSWCVDIKISVSTNDTYLASMGTTWKNQQHLLNSAIYMSRRDILLVTCYNIIKMRSIGTLGESDNVN